MKKILYMSNTNAKKYFMKNSSYFYLHLPEYYNFAPLLNSLDLQLNNHLLSDLYNTPPHKVDNVNYKILSNKDGKYAWRLLQLIHPALYIELVNIITEKGNWKILKKCFSNFKSNHNIVCCSDLVESSSKNNDTGASINQWWTTLEQESIRLSLEYNYIGITDITDCYSSIYTHSISWAIHGKQYSKDHIDDKQLLGYKIDRVLKAMSYGQTNGIPQGSTLCDFIAEIILGYCDILIGDELLKHAITKYKILRFRDDYHIFSNSKEELDIILKIISEVLSSLNLKINVQKTLVSQNVISSSIKKSKLDVLNKFNNNLNLQKHLLCIREFALEHPNSGSLQVLLKNLYEKRIEKINRKPKDIMVIISIIVDIMYNNSKTYDVCIYILSKLLTFIDKEPIIRLIENKFKQVPNIAYLDIWLQRLTILDNRNRTYTSTICQLLYNPTINLWNNSWLNLNIDSQLIIDENAINNISNVLPSRNLSLFDDFYLYH